MYEQIKEILKQNHLPFLNFLWVDNFGQLQLNNSEEYQEFIEDHIDNSFLFIFKDGSRKYYKMIRPVQIGSINVILVEEVNE